MGALKKWGEKRVGEKNLETKKGKKEMYLSDAVRLN